MYGFDIRKPLSRDEYLKAVQQYLANIGISASALRNQGGPGVVDAARQYLGKLVLTPLKKTTPGNYAAWLEARTVELKNNFPKEARSWGAARKALNILMSYAFQHKDVAEEFGLDRFGDVMETPLDKVAANKLRECTEDNELPTWTGLKKLKEPVSQRYQEAASMFAMQIGVPRACLDVILWQPTGDTDRSRA